MSSPQSKPSPASRPRTARSLWIALGSVLGLLVLAAVSMSRWTGHQPEALPGVVAADGTSFLTNFRPLHLVDQAERPFDPEALRGKVVLFNFIFTSCPSVCPVQTQGLAEVMQKLPEADRERVRFVSVSIDPKNDTPQVLRAFAARFKVDFSRWTFVTGGKADIDQLADRLRLFAENKERLPENHGTTLWLMDGGGRLMQRYAGNPPEVDRLVSELHALVQVGTGEPRHE